MFSVNLSALVENTGRLIVFSPPGGSAVKVLHIVVGLLVLLSTVALLKRLRAPALAFFCAMYTGQFLVWNFPPNERFFFPILFLLVAGLFHGLWRFLGRVASRRLATALWAACVVVLAGWSLSQTWTYVAGLLANSRLDRDRLACAARWVEANIPPDQQFLAYRDADLFLYTGRHGVRPLRLPQPYYRLDRNGAEAALRDIPDYARRAGLDYLFWDPEDFRNDPLLGDPRRREEIIAGLPGLILEHEACGVRVYRLTP